MTNSNLYAVIGNLAGPALYYLGVLAGWLGALSYPSFRAGVLHRTSTYRLCVLSGEPLNDVRTSVERCIKATTRRVTADFGQWMRTPFVHIVHADHEGFKKGYAGLGNKVVR